jgi:ribosomal peptide maturation radical SAM protein 1
MAYSIDLITMPFDGIRCPSIALTQLKAIIEKQLGDEVAVRIFYLNHEFGRVLGEMQYSFTAGGHASQVTGLGEWLFRRVAFPDLPDNTAAFIARYGHHFGRNYQAVFNDTYLPFRQKLPELLDAMIERYRLHESDVVGFTSMFQQNLASFALARRLKGIRPDVKIIMGGANCEGTMGIEIVNNVDVVDFVFSGPANTSLPKFIRYCMDKRDDECHKIDGVFSRLNSRSVASMGPNVPESTWGKWAPAKQLNGVRSLGTELDINTPIDFDYDDFFESLKQSFPVLETPLVLPFETSRGCWWGERAHCTFCGLNGQTMAYRAMNPDRAVAMIEELVARYGTRVSRLECVDNILPREYFDKMLPRLRIPEPLRMFYEVKADLTAEQVRVLADARVLDIQPGIEALATSTLKIMRKGTTAFHNVRLLQNCLRYGITPLWYLLVGFPGEKAETYEQYTRVLPDLFHLPPPGGTFPVRFDRFSPYFTQSDEYGLALKPYDYYEMSYPFSKQVLMNFAYYFEDQNASAPYFTDVANWIAPLRSVVGKWRTAWQEGKSVPSLTLATSQDATTLQDRRGEPALTHRLSEQELGLLTRLSEPAREEEVVDEHAQPLKRLRDMHLVFEERSRVMSLM